MNSKIWFSILVLIMSLASCGKSETASVESSTKKIAPLPSGAKVQKDDYGNVVFQREALQPFDRYVVINRIKNVTVSGDEAIEKVNTLYRTLFWAGAQVDYDLLAYDFLKEARQEKDTFKRADIAKQNQSVLDAAYKEAKANKYFALYFKGEHEASVGKYNPEKKGFSLGFSIGNKDSFGWRKPNEGKINPPPAWGFMMVGANSGIQDTTHYIPKNEEEARRIESKLSALPRIGDHAYLPVYYLGHVVSSIIKPSYGEFYNAIIVIDGVAVQDPETKQVLFTFDLSVKDKKVVTENYDLKRHFFPES